MFVFKNKTIGLLVAGLVIGSYNGVKMQPNKFLVRSFLTSLYAIPILGIIMAITSLITIFVGKGITLIDIMSKTQIFSKPYYRNVNYIMANIEED